MTVEFRMPFGKFRGELLTKVPASYLTWMIVQGHALSFKAEEELERRGTPCDLKISITPHSIDRASQRMIHLWLSTQLRDEGLYAWLSRRARAAVETVPMEQRVRSQRVEYDGIVFILEFSTLVPVLKSVWLAGSKDEP